MEKKVNIFLWSDQVTLKSDGQRITLAKTEFAFNVTKIAKLTVTVRIYEKEGGGIKFKCI